MKYNIGDVVKWSGQQPCIGRIIGECTEFEDSYKINNDTHNSLHFINLRLATQDEIELLGNKEIHILPK